VVTSQAVAASRAVVVRSKDGNRSEEVSGESSCGDEIEGQQ
jgi:hypothetical protein